MQSPTPLCKTILRLARAAEQGATGAGLTYLGTLQSTLATAIAAGGQKLMSASTASKSFAFADGFSTSAVTEALDEAFGIWQDTDTDALALLLDTRKIRSTGVFFGAPYRSF